ncbi:hypothetical protein GDO78_012125 [Eleutherodactylus coqui]|uniref:Uncharacterized protein n=1 Tax=Eleutherodactylus coqui TaxID=57060 RepID=A0A8J6F4B7_ELECQ|nr:hypothetical protein GDO78_012125 [Eleutherodactylus coqui]
MHRDSSFTWENPGGIIIHCGLLVVSSCNRCSLTSSWYSRYHGDPGPSALPLAPAQLYCLFQSFDLSA